MHTYPIVPQIIPRLWVSARRGRNDIRGWNVEKY
jgi:hypothetical protein